MKTVEIKTGESKFILSIPTAIEEITPKWLLDVTNNIVVAPNYALIGIIFRDSLGMIINSNKHKGEQSKSAIPVMVKSCSENTFIENISCGTPVIIAGSSIALGNHIISNINSISPSAILRLISLDEDCRRKHMIDTEAIYIVEFKLVPICEIHGCIERAGDFVNPYLTEVNDNNDIVLS